MTDPTRDEILALAERVVTVADSGQFAQPIDRAQASTIARALRLLAEQGEPVAWRYRRAVEKDWLVQIGWPDFGGEAGWVVEPLYAAPPAPAPVEAGAAVSRVRHKARGSTYRVIGEAEAQVSHPGRLTDQTDGLGRLQRLVTDGDRLTVYQAEHDNKLWARFSDEFNDGRFEEIGEADHG